MQKITSLSAKVFDRQSKEFRKIGGQAFWPRLYIIDSLREGRASSVLGNLSRNPSCNLRLLSLESTFSRK